MGDLVGPITPMTVRLTESAAEVADLFLKHRLGEAVVLDNLDRYVGLITAESVLFWSLQQRVLPTDPTGIVSEASVEIPGSSRVPTAVVATPTTDRPILLVEDHVPSRQALVSILRRRKFNVLESASVGEALSLAKLHKIALVISDIELPDGSGFGLMKELQQHYGLKGIAVTGVSLAGDRVRGRAAGFMFHLKKPINVRELENAILAILAQPSGVVS
jgi:CheY-like chemotaxis protein